MSWYNISDKTKERIVRGNHYIVIFTRGWQLVQAEEAMEEGDYQKAFYFLTLVGLSYLGVIANDKWRRNFEDYYRVD